MEKPLNPADRQRHRGKPMRHGVLVAVLLIAATGCSPQATDSAQQSAASSMSADESPEPAAAPTPVESPAVISPEVSNGAQESDVAVTPNGIPVAIVDRTDTGVVVRSPCGDAVEVASAQAMAPVKVVIDPGHGGPADEGARGPNGLLEADLNLTVAGAVQQGLEDRGISAALTRIADYAVPLAVRASFADAADAEILVSIHHNSPRSAPSAIPGTEVFIQSSSAESARLGGLLYEATTNALTQFDVAWTRAHDAGVLRVHLPDGTDAYGLIRRPQLPTALIEMGYLANPEEAELFATNNYIGEASTALADAVETFLNSDRAGIGYVDQPRIFTPGHSHAAEGCADPPLG